MAHWTKEQHQAETWPAATDTGFRTTTATFYRLGEHLISIPTLLREMDCRRGGRKDDPRLADVPDAVLAEIETDYYTAQRSGD